MDWSFSARFVFMQSQCSLTVSNAFQSSLRVLELMLEHAAACSSFIKFLTSTRPKASETSGGVFVETRNTKAVSRSSLPSQGNPICLNKWCTPLNPVEPRCTIGQAQRWFIKATPLQCFRDLCLTLLCGATSEGSVVQSRAAVQEMHCATSQDYLLWISGMQKSSQWQALTTLTHVIGSTYYIPYSLIYIYIYLPFPRPLYAGVYAGVFVGRQVAQQC